MPYCRVGSILRLPRYSLRAPNSRSDVHSKLTVTAGGVTPGTCALGLGVRRSPGAVTVVSGTLMPRRSRSSSCRAGLRVGHWQYSESTAVARITESESLRERVTRAVGQPGSLAAWGPPGGRPLAECHATGPDATVP